MFHLQAAPMRRPLSDWLADVDRILIRTVGVDHLSMEDWNWEDEYHVGTSPRDAVLQWASEQ